MAATFKVRFDAYFGGIALAFVIAAAATFLSEHYGAPAMLFALLIGMAFHFPSDNPSCAQGIEFSAKTLPRFGVGLPGLRFSVGDVENVGLGPSPPSLGLCWRHSAVARFCSPRRFSFS